MVTAPLSSTLQKKDLHVGGLGDEATQAVNAVVDQIPDLTQSVSKWVRSAVSETDEFLHANPWAAVAVAAAAGLAAGYLLSQRPRGVSLSRLRRGFGR